MFSGKQSAIDKATSGALTFLKLAQPRSILDIISYLIFAVAPETSEIALSETQFNAEHFKSIIVSLVNNKTKGLEPLTN